jgi:hypothetical protein
MPAGGLVVSALFFFPRGGSAQLARSLARALPAAGWQATLVAGSLGQWGEPHGTPIIDVKIAMPHGSRLGRGEH